MKNKIKNILQCTPRGNNYMCPHCETMQDYNPNPFYYHQCVGCGSKLQLDELVYISDEERLIDELYKVFEDELKEEINFSISQSFRR